MAELTPVEPATGLDAEYDGVRLRGIVGRAIVALAHDPADRAALDERLREALGHGLPTVGDSSAGPGDSSPATTHLLGLQLDQTWCVVEASGPDAAAVQQRLGAHHPVYLSEQSDGWAQVAIDGADSLGVLERLCPLDLDEARFPIGSCTRVPLEHIGTILWRRSGRRFELFVARSMLASLWHELETVARQRKAERALAP